MVRLRLMVFTLISLVAGLNSLYAEEKTYSFGIVPQFEARKLASIWVPILDNLEKETGYKFLMEGSARIPEFEAAFQRGMFDFAYMNPYHALVGFETQGYVPLVRDGGRQLYGVLVVKKESPYQNLKDLEGQLIAFPAPNALGASLLMRTELVKDFGLKFTPIYAQTHTSSYLNVVLKKTAAAGGVMASLKKQKKSIQDNLRILHETKKMAPHPLVAHPRVPSHVVAKVKQAFMKMNGSIEGRKMLSGIPMKKAVEAKSQDYQILKGWGLQEFYVKASN